MGNNEESVVYGYSDGVTLLVSEFTEGGCAKAEIPDADGKTVMRVWARREGDEIIVRVEGEGNYSIKNLGSGQILKY